MKNYLIDVLVNDFNRKQEELIKHVNVFPEKGISYRQLQCLCYLADKLIVINHMTTSSIPLSDMTVLKLDLYLALKKVIDDNPMIKHQYGLISKLPHDELTDELRYLIEVEYFIDAHAFLVNLPEHIGMPPKPMSRFDTSGNPVLDSPYAGCGGYCNNHKW